MTPALLARLNAYYSASAARYREAIQPAYEPISEALVNFAEIQRGDSVLDIGAGTGAASQAAKARDAHVVALDLAHAMLTQASYPSSARVQADYHHLPLRRASADVILAALAFNSGDPSAAFPEVRRVLRPGGRMALAEWGTADDLSELVSDTVILYSVDEPPDWLAPFRDPLDLPWDRYDTSDDIVEELERRGFQRIERSLETLSIPITVEAFMRYKLAWPIRDAELAAMDEEARQLCLSDLRENLLAATTEEGLLRWQPNLVFVRATA
ncbi:MAG: class I SAM-dependent methyltransferase [Chloroflexi bacterium]|nr:class I SAM-dependent methyltransferase [Chloroflexota bacterium]